MNDKEIARYRRRATEERTFAATVRDARAAQSHMELAEKYDAVADAYSRRATRGDGS